MKPKNLRELAKANRPVVAWPDCPYCDGRGWFLINPFATGGSNGAGGAGNMRQCEVCQRAAEHYEKHNELPAELQTLASAVKQAESYEPTLAECKTELQKRQEQIDSLTRDIRSLNSTIASLEDESDFLSEYEEAKKLLQAFKYLVQNTPNRDPDPYGSIGLSIQQRLDTMLEPLHIRINLGTD